MTRLQQNSFWPRLAAFAALVLVGVAFRLIPHPTNFSPIGALALFSGAVGVSTFGRGKIWGLALPLFAMALSDLVLGFHILIPVVYGSFVLVALLGMMMGDRPRVGQIALASVSSSVLFFFATNFAVWAVSGLYEKTLAGLIACFTLAIPFFGQTLAGDLVFAGLFFGAWAFVSKRVLKTEEPSSVETGT